MEEEKAAEYSNAVVAEGFHAYSAIDKGLGADGYSNSTSL
jgi:hypothetical protein